MNDNPTVTLCYKSLFEQCNNSDIKIWTVYAVQIPTGIQTLVIAHAALRDIILFVWNCEVKIHLLID